MRAWRIVVLGLVALLWVAAPGWPQERSRARAPSPSRDPDEWFNRLSDGRDLLNRSSLSPEDQRVFDHFAGQLGITNGKITRDLFRAYVKARRAQRAGRGPEAPPTKVLEDDLRKLELQRQRLEDERMNLEFRWQDINIQIQDLRAQITQLGKAARPPASPVEQKLDQILERLDRMEKRLEVLEKKPSGTAAR
jgi:hypothetical protein